MNCTLQAKLKRFASCLACPQRSQLASLASLQVTAASKPGGRLLEVFSRTKVVSLMNT